MIVVELSCGLGNQMFQYAMGRRMAHICDVPLVLDYSIPSKTYPSPKHPYKRPFNLDIFCLHENIRRVRSHGLARMIKKSSKFSGWMPLLCQWQYQTTFIEEKQVYSIEQGIILSPPKDAYMRGFWQSEQYFGDIAEMIRQDFSFAKEVLSVSNTLYNRIKNTQSICVHIRRGDYVGSGFDVLSLEYFARAIQAMKEWVQNPHFYVFCEDVGWCRDNLSVTDVDISFVDRIHDGELNANCFQLMASCKHFIISNSSFSWWAAWLGKDVQKIVLAPDQWKNHPVNIDNIVPFSWRKLPVQNIG